MGEAIPVVHAGLFALCSGARQAAMRPDVPVWLPDQFDRYAQQSFPDDAAKRVKST
jgi:hypothetical protein